MKCLPKDDNAIRLTKKYILCGKHNYDEKDYPKYEEKGLVTQKSQSVEKSKAKGEKGRQSSVIRDKRTGKFK